MSAPTVSPQYDEYDKYKKIETSDDGEDDSEPKYDNHKTYQKMGMVESVGNIHHPELDYSIKPVEPEMRKQPLLAVLKLWKFEAMLTTVAVAALFTILILLKSFDKKQTSEWKWPVINLTTVVAILSTIGRMSLAATVGSVIAQAKWAKFWRRESGQNDGNGRPLKDMDAYDRASRGELLGSLQLFTWSRGGPKVWLSVLVMVLSTGMASFAQQAVTTINCNYPSEQLVSTLPNSQMLGDIGTKWRSYSMIWKHSVSYATKAIVISSFADPFGAESEIHATCGGGNCSFPISHDDEGREFTHRSVGVCSKCIDASSSLVYKSESSGPKIVFNDDAGSLNTSFRTWSLPTGQKVTVNSLTKWKDEDDANPRTDTDYVMLSVEPCQNFSWARNIPMEADFLIASQHAFANVSVISLQNLTLKSMRGSDMSSDEALATLCTIYPCLRSYLASVQDGILVETPVASQPLTPYGDVLPLRDNDDPIPGNRDQYIQVSWTDALAIASPCVVGNQSYSKANLSSAPGAITLSRLRYEVDRDESHVINGSVSTSPIYANTLLVNITAPLECIYGVGHWWWRLSFSDYLAKSLRASCGRWGGFQIIGLPACIQSYELSMSQQANFRDLFWLEPLVNIPNRTTYEVTKWLEAATDSMTRRFRLSNEVYGDENVWDNKLHTVNGTVNFTTTCFEIQWNWLWFPSLLTFGGLITLIWTLSKAVFGLGSTHGVERIWKSSILPFVYHQERFMPVNDNERAAKFYEKKREQGWTPLLNMDSMEKDAKEYRVMFDGGLSEDVPRNTTRDA